MPIKLTILVALVVSSIMYWSLSNICRFNYSIDKKTKILNELAKEADIDFGSAKVYYFKELNCLPADTEFEFQRLILRYLSGRDPRHLAPYNTYLFGARSPGS